MGRRAHWAIRRGGKVRLHYSHWGAATVPEDVFFGPSRTSAFVSRLEPARVWLDDVWAEGGAAIDHDERVLAFYGGETEEDLINGWVTLMRGLWAGWTVRWVDGIPDLAGVMDLDPNALRGDPSGRPPPATPLPPQASLDDAAPRIWDALRRTDARKDVLFAHARQTLGGLPPEPVYGEDTSGHPQFLQRIPSSWPAPTLAEATFAVARAIATDAALTSAGAAVSEAIAAEDAALCRDLLVAWNAAEGELDTAHPVVARALDWLDEVGQGVRALV